jgi:hypothetical protein
MGGRVIEWTLAPVPPASAGLPDRYFGPECRTCALQRRSRTGQGIKREPVDGKRQILEVSHI